MKIEGKEYRTIWFENNIVKIIDQTKLPHQFIIKDLKTVKDSINAIKTMEVRGAPLIGATAAYGLVLSILEKNDQSFLKKSAEDLIKSSHIGSAMVPPYSLSPRELKLSFPTQTAIIISPANPEYQVLVELFVVPDLPPKLFIGRSKDLARDVL